MGAAASAAYQRFVASMEIGYEQWHDGEGYDLGALEEMRAGERESVEGMLIARMREEWRAVEALAALGTARAVAALQECLKAKDHLVRVHAASALKEMGEAVDMGGVLTTALESGDSTAFSRALDEVGWEKEMGAVPALLRVALRGSGENACNAAGMLYYLHGISAEEFDWNFRAFFLRFNTEDRQEREGAFGELCGKIGVEAGEYL